MKKIIAQIKKIIQNNIMNTTSAFDNIIATRDIKPGMVICFRYSRTGCEQDAEQYTVSVNEVRPDNIFGQKYVNGSDCRYSKGGGRQFNFDKFFGNIEVMPERRCLTH